MVSMGKSRSTLAAMLALAAMGNDIIYENPYRKREVKPKEKVLTKEDQQRINQANEKRKRKNDKRIKNSRRPTETKS